MSDTKQPKAVADSPISLGKKGRVSGDVWKHSVCLQMGAQYRNSANRGRYSSAPAAVTWLEGLCRSQEVVGIIVVTTAMGITINMTRKRSCWRTQQRNKLGSERRRKPAGGQSDWNCLRGAGSCLGHSHGNTYPLEGKQCQAESSQYCEESNSLVQGCVPPSREEILHEGGQAAEALQHCIHVARVLQVLQPCEPWLQAAHILQLFLGGILPFPCHPSADYEKNPQQWKCNMLWFVLYKLHSHLFSPHL